jgi:phospholipid transport system substrate-binding protein
MRMRLSTLLFSLFAALAAALPAAAQELGPEELVRKVTADVLEAVKSDQQLAAGDRAKALALAEQKILPHLDFREATQLAVGKAWHAATPAQQSKLVEEFRAMLVRIYSNAVEVYRGQTMRVLPVRMAPGDTEVTVRNQYRREGRPPVPVEYAMRKTPQGWKIYDITVEGVSLVLTYHAEFETVTRSSGVDGLIKRLQQKNA